MLGDMENKNYKILVSSPLISEPELLAFSETDGYLYFTDKNDEKTVKRVKPSVGLLRTVENVPDRVVSLVARGDALYWTLANGAVYKYDPILRESVLFR